MEAPVETFVKDFVWERTGETVYIDLSTPSVVLIRDVTKFGSSALAALWLNILQHPNNYPVLRYPYRKHYQKNGSYKVVLTVDDVTLTVSMVLGSLKIKGEFVLYWFQTQFLKVLDCYERGLSSPQPLNDKYLQMRKTWQEVKSVKNMEETNVIDISVQTVPVEEVPCQEEQVTEDKPHDDNSHMNDLTEALQMVNTLRGTDDDVRRQKSSLTNGSIQHGPEFIYILWQSLLEQWFKEASNRVYIVSPKIDVTRLKDVCQLILKHRLTANLEALYVHQKCDLVQNIGDVKRNVQTQYSSKDQVFIEYKIYSNIIYPLVNFECKFIACINGDTVSVLQTSANFNADHFDQDSVDTVSFHQMSKDEFHQRFLKPILASQVLKVSEN